MGVGGEGSLLRAHRHEVVADDGERHRHEEYTGHDGCGGDHVAGVGGGGAVAVADGGERDEYEPSRIHDRVEVVFRIPVGLSRYS